MNSGAPRHLSPDESGFENKRLLPDCFSLRQSDGKILTGRVAGDVTICPGLVLKGVVCVPGLEEPLLSVISLTEGGVAVYFDGEQCIFRDFTTGKFIASGIRNKQVLYLIERRI